MSYGPDFAAKSTVIRGLCTGTCWKTSALHNRTKTRGPVYCSNKTARLHFCFDMHATSFTAITLQKFIGRGDPVSWPRRSPDLTFLDFTVGNLLRISPTCLRFPTTLNCWGSRFHEPSCTWTSRWWTGHRQNWNVIGTYDVLRRERLLNFRKPTSNKTRIFCITFYVIDFRI